eukprot:gene24014-32421_t
MLLHLQRLNSLRVFGRKYCQSSFDFKPANLTETQFHAVSDEALETIYDFLTDNSVTETILEEDLDVNISQGVLNIILPTKGTWVINKQTPNRQLWWSSPISGPKRYDYFYPIIPSAPEDANHPSSGASLTSGAWISSKDRSEIFSALRKELNIPEEQKLK